MATKIKYLLMVVLTAFAFAGCSTMHREHSKSMQWEYTANDYTTANVSVAVMALNNLAGEGWTLVSAVPIKSPNGEDQIRYICKRPKQ